MTSVNTLDISAELLTEKTSGFFRNFLYGPADQNHHSFEDYKLIKSKIGRGGARRPLVGVEERMRAALNDPTHPLHDKAMEYMKKGGIGKMLSANPADPYSRGMIGDFLFGRRDAGDVTKARFMQGGLLGKGGVVSGALSPSDEQRAANQRLFKGLTDKNSPISYKDFSQSSFIPSAQKLVGFAQPIYHMGRLLADPTARNKGRALGSTLGSLAASTMLAEYGMIPQQIASWAAGRLGGYLGGALSMERDEPNDSLPRDVYGRRVSEEIAYPQLRSLSSIVRY